MWIVGGVLLSILVASTHAAIIEKSRTCKPSDKNHCYSLFFNPSTRLTRSEADRCCKGQGRSLVSIPDPVTQKLVEQLLDNGAVGSEGVWTSGETSNSTVWITLDGSTFQGTVTGSGDLYNCASIKKDTVNIHLLADSYRYLKHPLCQVKKNGDCGDALSIGEYCYKFLSEKTIWYRAVERCEQYAAGATLAYTDIHTDDFAAAVSSSDTIPDNSEMWVGAQKRPWFWNRLDEFRKDWVMSHYIWHPSAGSHGSVNNPQCALIQKENKQYVWHSASCNSGNNNYKYRAFICEHDPSIAVEKSPEDTSCKIITEHQEF